MEWEDENGNKKKEKRMCVEISRKKKEYIGNRMDKMERMNMLASI